MTRAQVAETARAIRAQVVANWNASAEARRSLVQWLRDRRSIVACKPR